MTDEYEVTVPVPEDGKLLVVNYEYRDQNQRWAEALKMLLDAGERQP